MGDALGIADGEEDVFGVGVEEGGVVGGPNAVPAVWQTWKELRLLAGVSLESYVCALPLHANHQPLFFIRYCMHAQSLRPLIPMSTFNWWNYCMICNSEETAYNATQGE